MSLKEIREKNNKKRMLLHDEKCVEFSNELIEQCKNEYENFVKPMRDEFLNSKILKQEV
ncbi:MAG: hypothetical protein ACRCVJ_11840 [Clostridium sp.]|uniref:hypothetical protein n=1 Tax=Clostridium sp. TaxID=1506 RepID=UPI003F39C175